MFPLVPNSISYLPTKFTNNQHQHKNYSEGEGQRIRNRIIQVMKHRESVRKQAIEDGNGESVEDWDKIVLVGKKIKS